MRPSGLHTGLGPGLLESVYEVVLAYELDQRSLRLARQQAIPVVYQGTRIEMVRQLHQHAAPG